MKNKRAIKFFIFFVLTLSIIGFILGILGELKVFYRKPIGTKYCYDQLDEGKYIFTYAAKYKRKAYELLEKHYNGDSSSVFVYEYIFEVRPFEKVDVLRYSKDSVFAYIRDVHYNLAHPEGYTHKGYVPAFTLFDTIPKCAPECFPKLPLWLK